MGFLRDRWVLSTALSGTLLLTTCATAGAAAPRLQASHAQRGASAPQLCNDVSWLNPPNAPSYVTDVPQTPTNCDFHEFVSQNLFALVLGGSPALLSWPTSDQAFPASGTPACGGGSPLAGSLRHRLAKHEPRAGARATASASGSTLDDIIEATGQALVDQNGRYVQFEIRVNPQLCQTISSCQLYKSACVTSAIAANPQFRFFAGDDQSGIPGVGEVKIAWRVMETCDLPDSPKNCKPDTLSQFVTVSNVTVSPYSPANSSAVNVTVGMVGFHLAQKTPNHPEFIWGTWEHVANAPVCNTVDNATCQDPSAPSGGVSTASGWSFTNPPVKVCASGQSGSECANIVQTNASKVQTATNVCRVFPCGGGSEPDNLNQINIATLNHAIRKKLGSNVWANYFLVGTLWGPGTTTNGQDPAKPNTGSVQLANSTMETYFQQSTNNCFSCHTYASNSSFGANLDFVHSVQRAQQSGSCPVVDFSTCSSGPAVKPIRSSTRGRR
ncbi:MAG TPA: hypothetical protein VJ885_18285 [Thermoanaerobaculia bacterium]|nr:hypothetical protein [Thermoanaerobaculia bacterium]